MFEDNPLTDGEKAIVNALLQSLIGFEKLLLDKGDPHAGDDWQLMQDVRALKGNVEKVY